MHTHNYTFCHSHTQYTHDTHTSTPTYLHTPSHTPIPSHSCTYPHQCTHPHTHKYPHLLPRNRTRILARAVLSKVYQGHFNKFWLCQRNASSETQKENIGKKFRQKKRNVRRKTDANKILSIFQIKFFSHFFGLAEDLCLTFWAEKNNVCFPVEAFLLVSTLFVFLAFEMVLKGILNW